MEITSKQILKVLYILSWIIFIGLCLEAGSFIFTAIYALFFNPEAANNHISGINLLTLYNYDVGQFCVISVFMIIVKVMETIMLYLIVKLLHDNKLNMAQPFSKAVGRFVFLLSYLSLGIGIFSHWGYKYALWLASLNVVMPNAKTLNLEGGDVWLFMAVILFVIAHIFKRGIEIQAENELTV